MARYESRNPTQAEYDRYDSQRPLTGIFGTGKIRFITANETFPVPAGIDWIRVRVWGAGANDGGAGGGFAIGEIEVAPAQELAITVAQATGQSSSVAGEISATSGTSSTAGIGSGGDFQARGGLASRNSEDEPDGGGGGAGSLLGDGNKASGHGGGERRQGRSGLSGSGGNAARDDGYGENGILAGPLAIDYIGTGPGGGAGWRSSGNQYGGHGTNGGGGGHGTSSGGDGGFPGGAGGEEGGVGAPGLVILEW